MSEGREGEEGGKGEEGVVGHYGEVEWHEVVKDEESRTARIPAIGSGL